MDQQTVIVVVEIPDNKYYIELTDNLVSTLSKLPSKTKFLYARAANGEIDFLAERSILVSRYGNDKVVDTLNHPGEVYMTRLGPCTFKTESLEIAQKGEIDNFKEFLDFQFESFFPQQIDKNSVSSDREEKVSRCQRCKFEGHTLEKCYALKTADGKFLCPGVTKSGTKCRWEVKKLGYKCKYHY